MLRLVRLPEVAPAHIPPLGGRKEGSVDFPQLHIWLSTGIFVCLHALLHEVADIIFNYLHRLMIDHPCADMVDTTQASIKWIWVINFNARPQQLPSFW